MTANELQEAIWRVDGIRVVIFTDAVTQLPFGHVWSDAFPGDRTVAEYRQARLQRLTDAGIGYAILDGMLEAPSNKLMLQALRASYATNEASGCVQRPRLQL